MQTLVHSPDGPILQVGRFFTIARHVLPSHGFDYYRPKGGAIIYATYM